MLHLNSGVFMYTFLVKKGDCHDLHMMSQSLFVVFLKYHKVCSKEPGLFSSFSHSPSPHNVWPYLGGSVFLLAFRYVLGYDVKQGSCEKQELLPFV